MAAACAAACLRWGEARMRACRSRPRRSARTAVRARCRGGACRCRTLPLRRLSGRRPPPAARHRCPGAGPPTGRRALSAPPGAASRTKGPASCRPQAAGAVERRRPEAFPRASGAGEGLGRLARRIAGGGRARRSCAKKKRRFTAGASSSRRRAGGRYQLPAGGPLLQEIRLRVGPGPKASPCLRSRQGLWGCGMRSRGR